MSPRRPLLTNCERIASALDISRLRPFSVTLTRCRTTLSSMVPRFCDPFGRPFGFPDCPLTNCLYWGGLPYPISLESFLSAMFGLRTCGDIVKVLASGHVNRTITRMSLPTTDRHIDVKWIDLDAQADTTDSFGRNQCAAGTDESIEDNLATSGTVEDGIGHQRDRFDGRVQGQETPFIALRGERIGAGVLPDIRAVTTEFAK